MLHHELIQSIFHYSAQFLFSNFKRHGMREVAEKWNFFSEWNDLLLLLAKIKSLY